jgi:6-phosphogluconolactonase
VSEPELRVFETPDQALDAAAQELAAAARGGLHVALSGGSVASAFMAAAEAEPNWSDAELWWSDERCVPPDDPRSNFRLARENLLERLSEPPRAVHRIRGELEPARAADAYDAELDDIRLGQAFQGIGPDGHTASLFPNDPALDEHHHRAVAVRRDDVDRVTLTLPVLCAAETVLFLAFGESKAEAVRRAFTEGPSRNTPASLVRSQHGRTLVLLDRAAAARLSS